MKHRIHLVAFLKEPPCKDPSCQLEGKIKEHILEEIIPTGLKKKKSTTLVKYRVCSFRGKHSETVYL